MIILMELAANRKRFYLVILAVIFCLSLPAQVVQSVGIPSKKAIPVFITDYPEEADLWVFMLDSKKQATGNKGLWYFQDSQTYADKKVFFVESKEESKLTIFFVEEAKLAAWKNKKKRSLLE